MKAESYYRTLDQEWTRKQERIDAALTCSCGHQRDQHQVWTASLMPELQAHNPSVLPFYAGCMECDCLAFKR